jgi:[acyl-carrier-protein] S-malonyltransferase
MESARVELEAAIVATEIKEPVCPMYIKILMLNLIPILLLIKQNLIAQLTGAVRWTQTVKHMLEDGATSFTEVGPGNVLQGLVKKVDRHMPTSSAELPA